MSSSYERIRSYTDSLLSRVEAQKEWHRRHPEYGQLHEVPDEVFEADPYPDTGDIITAERFTDMLVLILEAWERSR